MDIVLLEDNSLVILEINDTGTGLHPEHLKEDYATMRALVLRRMAEITPSRR